MAREYKKNNNIIEKKGFSIMEIIVSLSLFVFAIFLVFSLYSSAQKSYNKGSAKAELIQNARVCLDRMSREIRQALDMITILPETSDDISDPPPNEIFFRDGHDMSAFTYIKYYIDGTDLKRSHMAYYFAVDPSVYVPYDSVDASSDPPEELFLENFIIGEYFDDLDFWGPDDLVYISIDLLKGVNRYSVETSVFSRN
jgi:type II secretory pathway pseudopilin PulG